MKSWRFFLGGFYYSSQIKNFPRLPNASHVRRLHLDPKSIPSKHLIFCMNGRLGLYLNWVQSKGISSLTWDLIWFHPAQRLHPGPFQSKSDLLGEKTWLSGAFKCCVPLFNWHHASLHPTTSPALGHFKHVWDGYKPPLDRLEQETAPVWICRNLSQATLVWA